MDKPAVFIASSVEGLPVAQAINANLDHNTHPTLWRTGTFALSSVTIDSLIKKSSVVDFAVFVFTPDDLATIREKKAEVARDNVVFELGLFIGAIGLDRCYVVKPRGSDMHLPSDLLGITMADYATDRKDGDIASALNAACTKIQERIRELGPIQRKVPGPVAVQAKPVANPPDYKIEDVTLLVLAECVKDHAAYPDGIGYGQIQARLRRVNETKLTAALFKLTKLGHVEKTLEYSEHNESHYYAYKATDDGIELFLASEAEYERIDMGPFGD